MSLLQQSNSFNPDGKLSKLFKCIQLQYNFFNHIGKLSNDVI
jgi:hypothetical protein